MTGRIFSDFPMQIWKLKRAIDRMLVSPPVLLAVFEPLFRITGKRFPSSLSEDSKIREILVIRIDRVGDLVLMSPFLRELRRRYPEAKISLVLHPCLFNLMENCPYIDELIPWSGDWNLSWRWQHFLAAVRTASPLWYRQIDLSISTCWDVDSLYWASIAYLSGAARWIGYSESVNSLKKHENAFYDLLFSDIIFQPDLKHEAESNCLY